MDAFGSAFVGAIFAFASMAVWDAVVRHRDRWIRHYSGLVQLGRELNDQIGMIHDAIAEVDYIIEAAACADEEPRTLPLSMNQPEEIPISSARELDIVNLDLANDHASFRHYILGINRDIRRLADMKRKTEDAFAAGNLPPERYLANFKFMVQLYGHLRSHLKAAEDDVITLAAKTRVRMRRDKPWFHAISMKVRKTRYETNFTDLAAEERNVLMGEIETVSERSGRRIQDIQKGQYRG